MRRLESTRSSSPLRQTPVLQVAYDQRGWGTDWPTEACVPGFRKQTLAFMHKCHDLCLFILECFAEGLGLPLSSFSKVRHLENLCSYNASLHTTQRDATQAVPCRMLASNILDGRVSAVALILGSAAQLLDRNAADCNRWVILQLNTAASQMMRPAQADKWRARAAPCGRCTTTTCRARPSQRTT